jgi:hypothetical protein
MMEVYPGDNLLKKELESYENLVAPRAHQIGKNKQPQKKRSQQKHPSLPKNPRI